MQKLVNSISYRRQEQIVLFIVLLALALPFVLYFYTAFQYSTNVPVHDDFDAILVFMSQFLKTETFSTKLHLLFWQFNEHKVVFDRLIFLAQYYLTGEVNFKYLSIFGAFGWGLTVLLLIVLIQRKYKLHLIYLLPIPYILFTSVHQTFMFSTMGSIHHYWVIFFALLFLYCITEDKYIHAVVFYLLALYTSGHGLLLYPLGNILLLLRKKIKPFFIFLIASTILTLSYLYNYQHPSHHPSIISAIINFRKTAAYFLVFFGNMIPFLKPAILIGFLNFIILIALAVRRTHDRFLFSIVGLIVLVASSIALSRSGFGIQHALKPGYTMYSLLVWVCIYLFLIRSTNEGIVARRIILTTLTISVLFFSVVLFRNEINKTFQKQKLQRISGIAAFINGEKAGLTYPGQDKDWPAEILFRSKKLNIYDYKKAIAVYYKIPQELSLSNLQQNGTLIGKVDFYDNLRISGWALIPDMYAANSTIFILLTNDKHTLKLDTIKVPRHDVSKAYKKRFWYDGSGYEAYPPLYQIPPGSYRIGILVTNRGKQAFTWSDKVFFARTSLT